MQRYAQTWSGDNATSWETLRYNIRMGLGLALSGVSNSGHDVGGFAGPAPDAGLFVRWVEAGRVHAAVLIHSWNDDGTSTEPWMYPETLETVPAVFACARPCGRRSPRRSPTTASATSRRCGRCSTTFPMTTRCGATSDDFLLGRDILVAPVVRPGVICRVRLPAGADWCEAATGRVHAGGDTALPAPLDSRRSCGA